MLGAEQSSSLHPVWRPRLSRVSLFSRNPPLGEASLSKNSNVQRGPQGLLVGCENRSCMLASMCFFRKGNIR